MFDKLYTKPIQINTHLFPPHPPDHIKSPLVYITQKIDINIYLIKELLSLNI